MSIAVIDGRDGREDADPVVAALENAGRALHGLTARALATVDASVTVVQLRTLDMLGECGPLNMHALAEHIGVHPSTMTRMCARLLAHDLVVREVSEVDRREVVIRLAESGRSLVEAVHDARRRSLELAVDVIAEGDRKTLIRALEEFTRRAGRTGA